MSSLLFLGLGAGLMIVVAIKNSSSVKLAVAQHSKNYRYVPRAITMLVMATQISELVKAIEHISIVNIVAALLLLAIVVATTSGTEGVEH